MKKLLPHIFIDVCENGQIKLVVEDYELFDFIDDYLIETCELPYETISITKRVGGEIVVATFPPVITSAVIEESILQLSPEEVESIYRLNNKLA